MIRATVGLIVLAAAGGASAQTVRFLTNESDPAAVTYYNNMIRAFQAQNPGITVELEAVNSDARLKKITASLNARTMPEVFKINTEERAEFVRKGFLLPLDDLVREIGENDFVPGALTKIDGRVYDIPYALNQFGILCFRQDWLSAASLQPPRTWADMLTVAKATTSGDNFGFIMPAAEGRLTSIFLAQLMWSAGGTFFDKDFNVTFDNPGTLAALGFLREAAQFSPRGISSYSWGDMVNVYLTGRIAQNLYAPRMIETAAKIKRDVLASTDCAVMPKGPGGVGVAFVSPNNLALASPAVGGRNAAAARRFMRFMLTGERLRDFALLVYPHMIPPLQSAQREVIASAAGNAVREELARVAYAIENGLSFETEAGATFVDGRVVRAGVDNPFIGPVIARNIPAQVVQRVVLRGEDPARAAAWGAEEMRKLVADLKRTR
jgi:ABC-type glycerol-3-phosphate transport system substrate-binding protein